VKFASESSSRQDRQSGVSLAQPRESCYGSHYPNPSSALAQSASASCGQTVAYALASNVPILLQKSAIVAARPLSRFLGTVLTIRSLRATTLHHAVLTLGSAMQDIPRSQVAAERPASQAGVGSAQLRQA
jgi:hypothetical protein